MPQNHPLDFLKTPCLKRLEVGGVATEKTMDWSAWVELSQVCHAIGAKLRVLVVPKQNGKPGVGKHAWSFRISREAKNRHGGWSLSEALCILEIEHRSGLSMRNESFLNESASPVPRR